MAYSSAAIPSDELALYNAGKPAIVPKNLTEIADDIRWNQTGTFATADDTNPDYPTHRIHDGQTATRSRAATISTTQYLLFRWDTIGGQQMDSYGFIGHNLGALAGGGGANIQFQIADDSAFTVNLVTVLNATILAGGTIRRVSMSTTRRTNVDFARIVFTGFAAASSVEIGEVMIGRRRQLKHKSTLEYNPDGQFTEYGDFQSRSGVITRYVKNRGRQALTLNLNPHETAYIDDLIAVRDESDYFARSIYYAEAANAPILGWLMAEQSGTLAFPYKGPFERATTINLLEQGGSVRALEVS